MDPATLWLKLRLTAAHSARQFTRRAHLQTVIVSDAVSPAETEIKARVKKAFQDSSPIHKDPHAIDSVWQKLTEAGCFGCVIPGDYGGNDQGIFALTLALEEMGRHGIATALPILTAFATQCIVRSGTTTLKQAVLPRIAKGERRVCVAMTEETSGFNFFALQTEAKRQAGHYLLNGSKVYTSGFDITDYSLVVARTTSRDECKRKGLPKTIGLSVFLVDNKTPGIRATLLNTRGEGEARQFKLDFADVKVPAENLIGKEDEGALAIFPALNLERILFSAGILGLSQFCLDVACDHARHRKVFGDIAIGRYQAIQHPLADVKIRQEAVRLMVYRAARESAAGADPAQVMLLANAAKYLTSELGLKAVDAALEALGGRGFNEDSGIIPLWEIMRLTKLSPISNSLILNEVSERVLNLPRTH